MIFFEWFKYIYFSKKIIKSIWWRFIFKIQYLQNDPPSTEESSNADHDGNMKKKAIFTNPYLSRLFSVIVMQFGSMFA